MTLLHSATLQKNRVVIAMSGGVDSSVAAALLVEQGYEVIGMMMRLWSEPTACGTSSVNRCCTPDQMADAQRIADSLGIPFYVLDVQEQFRRTVVDYFIEEHEQGRTPNPCIQCNRQIRFTYLLNRALALDAHYLATGHYAQVVEKNGRFHLYKARDPHKDQSYVLHVLRQEHLAHVLFPVGGYTKTEVRELARRFNLPVAGKSDSQDLCFLGDGDYRRFLREYSAKAAVPGPILTTTGQEIGRHEGLPFYTIGQRKGLGISTPEPVYVLRKEAGRNALVVGTREQLGQQTVHVRDVNWVMNEPPAQAFAAQVKIRYKAEGVPAQVVLGENGRVQVQFQEPVFGVTAGQGAVFYNDDECVGGGIIADVFSTSDDSPGGIIPAGKPVITGQLTCPSEE